MVEDTLSQNIKKIGPRYSSIAEKQAQVVQMVKRYELRPELKTRVNMEIPGLRKKKTAFSSKPANKKWWAPLGSLERNGMINVFPQRNWARFIFPCVPMFFFFYMMQPVIHGHIYYEHYNNYQWESLYHKYGSDRLLYVDQTITRLA